MVGHDDVLRAARLMRIRAGDPDVLESKVGAMLEYFETLDSAGYADEEMVHPEAGLEDLREDEHVPYGGPPPADPDRFRDGYLRAPRMP